MTTLLTLPVAALALLLSGCAIDPDSRMPGSAARPLKIATWNMEHLAEVNGMGCRPRTDADYADLRSHVARLDADVIAFQEVETRAAAERVFDPARYDVVISGRPISGRGGGCYGAPGQSIRQQDVGFAVRKGVAWTRNPDVKELGLGNPDLRWGVDITVAGREPLRLLAIHLKSGCNSGQAPGDADCPVLFSQGPVLARWIDARTRAGEAFAILGDWNRRLAARNDQFFASLDRAEPAAADLTLTSEGRGATCKSRYREFIDFIVVGAEALKRVAPDTFSEYTYGVSEDAHPSDHCPIAIGLRPS